MYMCVHVYVCACLCVHMHRRPDDDNGIFLDCSLLYLFKNFNNLYMSVSE